MENSWKVGEKVQLTVKLGLRNILENTYFLHEIKSDVFDIF